MPVSDGGRGIDSLDGVAEYSAMRDCCRCSVPIVEGTDETARARVFNVLGGGEVARDGRSVSKGGGLGSNNR